MLWLNVCVLLSIHFVKTWSAAVSVDYKSAKTCETEGCKIRGKRILDYMDTSVDPCEDFYMFTCGKFISKDIGTEPQDSSFTQVAETLFKRINDLITEPTGPNDPEIIQDVKRVYSLCLEEGEDDPRGTDPILNILREKDLLRLWPLSDAWDPSSFSVEEAEILLQNTPFGGNSLFEIGPTIDPFKNTRPVLGIAAPSLVSKKRLQMDVTDADQNLNYKQFIAMTLSSYTDIAKAIEISAAIAAVEVELSKIINPEEDERKFKVYSIEELQGLVDGINWKTLVNNILPKSAKLKTNQPIILVKDISYLKNLQTLMTTTNTKSIAAFMMWHTVFSLDIILKKNIETLLQDEVLVRVFEKVGEGSMKKTCTDLLTFSLPLAVASMYMNKYVGKETKSAVTTMTKELNTELIADISKKDWMDESTRKQLKDKADHVAYHIAYPDEILEPKAVEDYYKGFDLNKKYVFEIIMEVGRWKKEAAYLKFLHPGDRFQWKGVIPDVVWMTVNAMYAAELNAILIPGAIIQPPFFGADLPKYVNYASLGYVLGHEFTHGFDNRGVKFDVNGNLNEFWSESSKKNFKDKGQCFVRQYNDFKDKQLELQVNGTRTLGENIADNGGLRIAYYAYQSASKQLTTSELSLPGLQQYDNDQLFMISAANMWCTNTASAPETVIMANEDEHAVAHFRVNGPLMNMPEFSELFSCPGGSKMNLKKRCEIW